MLATTLIILVIGQRASDPSTLALERALHGVLGAAAKIELQALAEDPPDEASVVQAAGRDGLVELLWAGDGSKAHVHCYLVRESRWVDREISFGAGTASPEREATERGRLLGFAVGTMFAEEAELRPAPEPTPDKQPVVVAATPTRPAPSGPQPADANVPTAPPEQAKRLLEFAGTASEGLHGSASGLGASAGLRLALSSPIWARLFLAGRGGNIEIAQATTRTALFGGGLALAALPSASRFELGLRTDLFASYFAASHLSEDDVSPDSRGRWLPGADLVAEAGVHVAGRTGLFLGAGLEAMFGKTEVYTKGVRVAVVPPFRVIGEFGFRTPF
ncbi:MAG TPA: hypothetical protein VNG33_02255 [Polyangiaceae bacterium]|nr:hypothetical protein [Polyangiaceae bacterium]